MAVAPILGAAAIAAQTAPAQQPNAPVPFSTGVALVQTLHEGDVDRESVIVLSEVSPRGIEYKWNLVEYPSGSDTVRDELTRFVSTDDLAHARQWNDVYGKGEPIEHPGYTGLSISADVYQQLVATGSTAFSILAVEPGQSGLPIGHSKGFAVRWRGTLSNMSRSTVPFPLLLDNRRVMVPALHVKGQFVARGKPWNPEMWILADRGNPLILKLADDERTFQTVRINQPRDADVEKELATSCRAELHVIYFEFNSATLDPVSDNTIADLAKILMRHPAWNASIEGHTDNIGTPQSNQVLSQRRAESVRVSLITHHIGAAHLRSIGYGATKPRESNNTIEGRARNRRVEVVRACGGTT